MGHGCNKKQRRHRPSTPCFHGAFLASWFRLRPKKHRNLPNGRLSIDNGKGDTYVPTNSSCIRPCRHVGSGPCRRTCCVGARFMERFDRCPWRRHKRGLTVLLWSLLQAPLQALLPIVLLRATSGRVPSGTSL